MEKILLTHWNKINAHFGIPSTSSQPLLQQLQQLYTQSHRAYHNLAHIGELVLLWERDYSHFDQPYLLALAIWYHDAIYKPYRKDNELASAKLAVKVLASWNLSPALVDQLHTYIVSTATHNPQLQEKDLYWFLDADLSILGSSPDRYQKYSQQIRQEYAIYPSFLYRPGRRKVLRHMLGKEKLFVTPCFSELEEQARLNLERELSQLA